MSILQPAAGDVVLGCPHAFECYGNVHWFTVSCDFKRPDGSKGHAKYQIACDACYITAGGDPYKIPVTTDGKWDGTPVTIREPS